MTDESIAEKRCPRCQRTQPLTQFYRDSTKASGHISHCKECLKLKWKKYQPSPEVRERRRALAKEREKRTPRQRVGQHLRKKYGISLEQYEKLVERQHGRCAVCGRQPADRNKIQRLAVDHCHLTGRVRGLLCSNCNTGIGNLRDSVELLGKAIAYLQAHQ